MEEDLYSSSFPVPVAATAAGTEAAAAAAAPIKRHFAPFELDQIYRAWALRMRPVRTRPCLPYSECAPLPPLVGKVSRPLIVESRWLCDAGTVVVCENTKDTPLVAWNEPAEETLCLAYSEWKVETARWKAAEEALRRRSLEIAAIVTPDSFETCRVDPVPAEQALLSHIRLWENGTFHFTPIEVGRSPTVYLGLQERFVDMSPGDVDLRKCGFDLTCPFTICETPRAYIVTQGDLVCELSRVGLIRGIQYVERQQVPLSLSFADLSFDVQFEDPQARQAK